MSETVPQGPSETSRVLTYRQTCHRNICIIYDPLARCLKLKICSLRFSKAFGHVNVSLSLLALLSINANILTTVHGPVVLACEPLQFIFF